MTVNAVVGGQIRNRRKMAGLTLRDLGSRAGLSIGYLSDLENGKQGVSAENLLGIARALRVTPNYFYGPLLGASKSYRKTCSEREGG